MLAGLIALLCAAGARANVVGADVQNFNPTPDGLDFVTVQSSETLKPGVVNLGFFLNLGVNSLTYYQGDPQTRLNFNDSLLGADFNVAIGLIKDWEIGASFPQILTQSISSDAGTHGELAQTGNTEIRLFTKYRLWGDDSGGFALVLSSNFNRIENDPYAGSGAGPTVNVEAAADTTAGRYAIGGNVGRRFRNSGSPIAGAIVRPLKDEWIASVAASRLIEDTNVKVIGELYGATAADSGQSVGDRASSSIEALLGTKWDVTTNWAVHSGVGAGLVLGYAVPDWRVYAGVNYAFGPLWGQNEKPYLKAAESTYASAARPTERFVTQSILFEFNSDQMLGDYPDVLAELAQHLPGPPPFKKLVVEGHTDSIGGAAYNQKLSLKRAEAIKRWLVSRHGVPASKIETIGYGKAHPIADNGNYQGRQKNRRVEFAIYR